MTAAKTISEVKDRHWQILDHAAQIIAERGYYGFGLQELAQRCGLSKPGLLHHIISKDQLLIAMLRDRDGRDERAFTARQEGGPLNLAGIPSLNDLFITLLAIVERNATQPGLVRLYVVLRAEALNIDHPAHEYMQARENAALSLFTEMVEPFVDDASSVARHLLIMMTGLEHQWLHEQQSFDLAREWEKHARQLNLFRDLA